MERFRRSLLFSAIVYFGILLKSLAEYPHFPNFSELTIFFGWPLIPMYYIALLGGPMLMVYFFFITSKRLIVHLGLAALSCIYMFVVLYLLASQFAVREPQQIGSQLQLTAKYGTILFTAVLLTFYVGNWFVRSRLRHTKSQNISAFD
jgi:hypothetical protein